MFSLSLKSLRLLFIASALGAFGLAGGSFEGAAQQPDVSGAVDEGVTESSAVEEGDVQQPSAQQTAEAEPAKDAGGFSKKDFASVLFTFWEHEAIRDAQNSVGNVRAPTESEINRALGERKDGEATEPSPEERDIRLGGIVYRSKDDWTIWLNEKRVTPEALPEEVIDLRVFDEYIEMKWFDEYTNQIFPIRLRTHQRFNLDTRMFLPG